MQGLLASTIALVAGCTFSSPEIGSPNGADPDATPAPDAPAIARCKMAYEYDYNGHKYHLIEAAMSWSQAKALCEADGGYLLKFDSQSEDNQAAYLISEQTEIWIGLHDTDQNGAYLWLDGTPPSFTHWSGTPGAASPDCVVKNTLINDGRWYPRDCIDARPAVCECTL